MRVLIWFPVLLMVACGGAGTTTPPDTISPELVTPTPQTVLPTPVASVVPSETVAATLDAVERGRALFRNKGCITCHVNNQVEGQTGVLGPIGPNLTNYTNDPEFLRRWLADPPAVRPGTQMPNLRLSTAEIEDLIAFLNEPR